MLPRQTSLDLDQSGASEPAERGQKGLWLATDGSGILLDGRDLSLQGQALSFVSLLMGGSDVSYPQIRKHIWRDELASLERVKELQLNQIHHLASKVRGKLGPAAVVKTETGYRLVRERVGAKAGVVERALPAEIGHVAQDAQRLRILFGRKVESERTIVSGPDPLGYLLTESQRLLEALDAGRYYWLVASDREKLVSSLVDLAALLVSRKRKRLEGLQVLLVEEEIKHISIVLEERRQCYLRGGGTLVLEETGESVRLGARRWLMRYPVTGASPMVVVPEKLQATVREAFLTLASGPSLRLAADDFAEAWFTGSNRSVTTERTWSRDAGAARSGSGSARSGELED